MKLLEFIFQDFEHFAGTVILLVIIGFILESSLSAIFKKK